MGDLRLEDHVQIEIATPNLLMGIPIEQKSNCQQEARRSYSVIFGQCHVGSEQVQWLSKLGRVSIRVQSSETSATRFASSIARTTMGKASLCFAISKIMTVYHCHER